MEIPRLECNASPTLKLVFSTTGLRLCVFWREQQARGRSGSSWPDSQSRFGPRVHESEVHVLDRTYFSVQQPRPLSHPFHDLPLGAPLQGVLICIVLFAVPHNVWRCFMSLVQAMLACATFLQGFLNFCAGCFIFGYLVQFGLVSKAVFRMHVNTRREQNIIVLLAVFRSKFESCHDYRTCHFGTIFGTTFGTTFEVVS